MPLEDLTLIGLRVLHTLAWCIYVGGAICMEVVLKHAQDYMHPSQTAVVCQRSGYRYRWWSLGCLIVLLASGLGIMQVSEGGWNSEGYRWLPGAAVALWCVQIGILALLSFYLHPEMHLRVSASMSAEEIRQERRRVGRAITSMALTVRIELGLALLAMLLGLAMHLN